MNDKAGNGGDEAPGFEFPCEYQIKAMGIDDGRFHEVVIEIISRHTDSVRHDSIRKKPSRNGRYISVTVVIEARSRAQLDAIYDDLTAHEKVLMRL
jgi:putative lipoic acid-binding regulatory protein